VWAASAFARSSASMPPSPSKSIVWKRPVFAAKACETSSSERISRPLMRSTPTGSVSAICELTACRSSRVSTTTSRSAASGFSASRNRTTRREVDPYRLWYAGGALYLIAFDHRREQVRLFAVDRIESLTLTNHAYQIPLGFDVEEYVQDALVIMRGEPITVELIFSKPTAAWVKDRIWHPSQQTALLKDGRLKMTLQVADTRELAGWILSFGSGVRVIKPEALRAKVREEARKILQQKRPRMSRRTDMMKRTFEPPRLRRGKGACGENG